MDKVKKILEGYVEWIALAAGAALPAVDGLLLRLPAAGDRRRRADHRSRRARSTSRSGTAPARASQAQLDSTPGGPGARAAVRRRGRTRHGRAAAGDRRSPGRSRRRPSPSRPTGPTARGPDVQHHGRPAPLVTRLPDAPALVHFDVAQGHSNILPVAPAGGTAPACRRRRPAGRPAPRPSTGRGSPSGTPPRHRPQRRLHRRQHSRRPRCTRRPSSASCFREEMTAAGTWGRRPRSSRRPSTPCRPCRPPLVSAADVDAQRDYLVAGRQERAGRSSGPTSTRSSRATSGTSPARPTPTPRPPPPSTTRSTRRRSRATRAR